MAIDLNSDVGETASWIPGSVSEELLSIVSSANVACGGHAGSQETMAAICEIAAARQVAIGAHVSYPDREGFGRRPMEIEIDRLIDQLVGQISVLDGIALAAGSAVTYVKPHGALYNQAMRDQRPARAIIEAIRKFSEQTGRKLAILCLPNAKLMEAAAAVGYPAYGEAFADRAYTSSGELVPRNQPGAVITDPKIALGRLKLLLRNEEIITVEGAPIQVRARSICIHGDTPGAVMLARRVKSAIDADRVRVAPFAPPPRRRPPVTP